MTGPEHYRRAEELAAEAHRLLGQGNGQATASAWAAVAQTHAVLALAAATPLSAHPARMTRRGASQHRHADPAHIGDQAGVGRPGPGIRGCQQGEHERGIVVQTVERHPHDRAILG